ncbi:MAG: Eco57I restriction-modification methylase domain-containing protein [Anaerolineae bacterium]|nr:Eco57I restriction-modification methylase domain-containing protein [Anaerolineae bacterium]
MSFGPRPLPDEYPAEYAQRVGEWYASWNKPDKALGQFFTPLTVARFMAGLVTRESGFTRVLDAGAGLGILSCAVCEALEGDIALEAYEVDGAMADALETTLAYAQQWMDACGRRLTYRVIRQDFILTHGEALVRPTAAPFDLVIANPPYFKLSRTDARARAAEAVVHGQPNIYALFMAVGAALLREGGQAVFITPRSYAAGPYFSRFRADFFSRMRPRVLHLFESRQEVFADVLQESLILAAECSSEDQEVLLSSSTSFAFSDVTRRIKPLAEVLGADNVLHLPLSEQDDAVAKIVRSWNGRLADYGMAVSTGPVVAFRAADLIDSHGDVPVSHAPLLWMQNVKPMRCAWPVRHRGQYIQLRSADKVLLPNQNYVLLRRFSAKEERQRLVAAPYLGDLDGAVIGLENHLNYIYRPGGRLSEDEVRGLAVLLNSSLMDAYFRIFSGHTQVNATEIRRLPLPPLEAIMELGRLAADSPAPSDALMAEALGLYA